MDDNMSNENLQFATQEQLQGSQSGSGNMHMSWSARTIGAMLLGNILYALTVKLFLLPANLASGGATGIALAAHYATGLSVSGILLLVNVSMLVVGFFALGKSFVVTTLLSTFLIPAALEVFDKGLGDFVLTRDILLCTCLRGLEWEFLWESSFVRGHPPAAWIFRRWFCTNISGFRFQSACMPLTC